MSLCTVASGEDKDDDDKEYGKRKRSTDSSSDSSFDEANLTLTAVPFYTATAVLSLVRLAEAVVNTLIAAVSAMLGLTVVYKWIKGTFTLPFLKEIAFTTPGDAACLLPDAINRTDVQQATSRKARPTTTENFSPLDWFRYSFDAEMMRFSRAVKLSSYCLCKNNDLIVHPMRATDAPTVEEKLGELLKKYDVHTIVNVVVRPDPVVATSCNIISNGALEQNIGLYISEEGSVYWLSVAHGVVQSDKSKFWHTPNATFSMHSGDIPPISVKIPKLNTNGETSYKLSNLPTPYVCFCINESGFEMSKDSILYHGVDIMVGPLTLLSEDGISTCFPMMNTPIHLNPSSVRSRKWICVNIRNLPEKPLEGGMYFSAEELVGSSLESYSWVHSKTLKGSVKCAKWTGNYVFGDHDKDIKRLHNAILIKSECDNEPMSGDSGSVWIQRKPMSLSKITYIKDNEHTSGEQHEATGRRATVSTSCGSHVDEDAEDTTAARADTLVETGVSLASSVAEHSLVSIKKSENNIICEENPDIEAVAVTVATFKDGQESYWVATPLCSSLYALSKVFPKKFPEKIRFKGAWAFPQ